MKKTTRKQVNYRKATGEKSCNTCAMRHGLNCDILVGKIDKKYVCDKWTKKEGS